MYMPVEILEGVFPPAFFVGRHSIGEADYLCKFAG